LLRKEFNGTRTDSAVTHNITQLNDSEAAVNTGFYTDVNTCWRKHIRTLSGTNENLRMAIRFSNIQDVLLDLDIQNKEDTKKVPTAHMMFPILFGFNFDKRLEPLLKETPHLAKVYEMARVLYLYNVCSSGSGARPEAAKRMLRKVIYPGTKGSHIDETVLIRHF
jgi:hypothetical protein